MKKLFYIVASPRGSESRTLRLAKLFVDGILKRYPECIIDELNLYKEELPELTVKRVDGKYALLGGKALSEDLRSAWDDIVKQIDRFMAADAYLVSSPMWNFSIPYKLKQYIDIIVQPQYLFRYTDKGPEGLVKNRKMLVVTSRGGDYSEGSPSHKYDLQEPYLRSVFGFVGLTDITFINAQPMDALGPAVREAKIKEAQDAVMKVVEKY